ncbi:hypothetical protein O1L60_36625 [Streptomyces diastatochromogenes]|nr:hypothetical protein [Streptomyces diastatochromogenes]
MPSSPSSGVDFFAREALPAPRVTEADARRIAAEAFGLAAHAASLGSQQDTNFLLRGPDGTPAAVLKIANPAFSTTEIEAQDAAADLIAAAEPALRVATVLRDRDGARQAATVDTAEGPLTARLLRYLPGGSLSGPRHLSPRTVSAMGAVAGRVSTTLRDFRHPGLDRVLQWDIRHADRVVDLLLRHVPDPRTAPPSRPPPPRPGPSCARSATGCPARPCTWTSPTTTWSARRAARSPSPTGSSTSGT